MNNLYRFLSSKQHAHFFVGRRFFIRLGLILALLSSFFTPFIQSPVFAADAPSQLHPVDGVTKGQASPTSQHGFKTPVQTEGVFPESLNPLALAISLDASFVARAFAGDMEQTKQIIKKAILHKGYALVDILQPCVTYNKLNTYKWFKANTAYLEESHNPHDRMEALRKATEGEKYHLGIFCVRSKPTFEESLIAYRENKEPLYLRHPDLTKVVNIIDSKRGI